MSANGDDGFSKVERFLMRLALLILLFVALLKVVAPEVKSLAQYFVGGHEATMLGR